jgi:hypothetical protein
MPSLSIALLLSTQLAVPPTVASRSAETQHIAAIVGLAPDAPATEGTDGANGTDGTDGDATVQQPRKMDRVVVSLLDADIAIATINNEISELNQQQARLRSRSDSRIKKLTIAGILLAAGGLTGELIEFDASRETFGAIIESAAAAAGVVVGVLALRQEGHGRTRQDVHFNMLAQVLDRPAMATSTYPDVVWKYLNSGLPGSGGATPRQQLLTVWSQNKLLGKKGPDEATIDSLTSTHAAATTHTRLSIDDIEDRVSMLTDTAARIALLKQGLRDLVAETEGGPITPAAR